jgi:hypothetical protein
MTPLSGTVGASARIVTAGGSGQPPFLLAAVSAVTLVVTLGLLRWRAVVRSRGLPELRSSEGARWMALGRVMGGGKFLGTDGGRPGQGSRGTLVWFDDTVEWRPDRWEMRHGYRSFSWSPVAVRCIGRRRRRDISGLSLLRLELAVPEGSFELAVIGQDGDPPPAVADWP